MHRDRAADGDVVVDFVRRHQPAAADAEARGDRAALEIDRALDERHRAAAVGIPGGARAAVAAEIHDHAGIDRAVAVHLEDGVVLDRQRARPGEVAADTERDGVPTGDGQAGDVVIAANDIGAATEVDVGEVVDGAAGEQVVAVEIQRSGDVQRGAAVHHEDPRPTGGDGGGFAGIDGEHTARKVLQVVGADREGRAVLDVDIAGIGDGACKCARAKVVARVEQQHPAGQVVERAAGQGKHGAVVAAGIGELHQTAVVQRPRHGQDGRVGLAVGVADQHGAAGLNRDPARQSDWHVIGVDRLNDPARGDREIGADRATPEVGGAGDGGDRAAGVAPDRTRTAVAAELKRRAQGQQAVGVEAEGRTVGDI